MSLRREIKDTLVVLFFKLATVAENFSSQSSKHFKAFHLQFNDISTDLLHLETCYHET